MKSNLNNRAKTQLNSFRVRTSLTLAALVLVPVAATFADSFWIGGTSTFNNPASWDTGVVPTARPGATQNANNDNGSNNVVLINPGDPIWTP
jgi:hypothetical protein